MTDPTARVQLSGTATAASELLLRARNRADNIMETLPYVPGSSLRGALAQRWLAAGTPDAAFQAIFQSGQVRFEHAYPLAGEARTVPAPLTFLACKLAGLNADHVGRDVLRADEGVQCEADAHGQRPAVLERVRGFVTTDPQRPRVVDEDAGLVSRQRVGTMADGSGRVRQPDGDEGGALFEERLVAAGTRFGVCLSGPRELLEQLVAGCGVPTGGALSLGVGRARTVRGELTIQWDELQPADQPCEPAGETHALLLTSDTILLDGYQRSLTALGSTALLARELLGCAPAEVTVDHQAVRSRAVSGWDALHGLPKPTDTAMVAGSVVRFSAPTAAVCQLAQRPGLGWRQAEGYGGFLLDADLHDVSQWTRWTAPEPPQVDDTRDRIAHRAHQLAEQLAAKQVSRSLWQGITQTVRQGEDPQHATEPAAPTGDDADAAQARRQSLSARGGGAGRKQRTLRREAIEAYRAALDELGVAGDQLRRLQLADDVAKELELAHDTKINQGGGRR